MTGPTATSRPPAAFQVKRTLLTLAALAVVTGYANVSGSFGC